MKLNDSGAARLMVGVVEVVCRSGCGRGEATAATWIALGAAVAAVLTVGVGLLEVRRLVRSIAVGQQANAINAISHCAQRYHEIMRDVTKGQHGVSCASVSTPTWWYRYWDLHTEQFALFTKGLLDPEVYQLWMTELAGVYNEPPNGRQTRAVAHASYLDKTLPQHVGLQSFFRQLSGISADIDPGSRAAQVQALISAYTPQRQSRVRRLIRALHGPEAPPKYQVLVSEEAINRRVHELAVVIDRRYAGKRLAVVAIMQGGWVFAHALAEQLGDHVDLLTIDASSYKGGRVAKPVTVGDASKLYLKMRDVLIVDDIIETGKTLAAVCAEVTKFSPRPPATCVLLAKPGMLSSKLNFKPDYVGFGSIPNKKFVVGYGIDDDDHHRDLPYISAVNGNGALMPAFPS